MRYLAVFFALLCTISCAGTTSRPVTADIATGNATTTGTVNVIYPPSGRTFLSSVRFTATATTSCAKGVASMGIYTAPYQLAYKVNGAQLDTTLSLAAGTYNAVVQEWDNCGGAAKSPVRITVAQPTVSLLSLTGSNTSAGSSFQGQANGNSRPLNVSKEDIHTLLYPGATTKIYAHLMPWFCGSSTMNVGYCSNDPVEVHRQIDDMISRGIDGVIIDWYGPGIFADDVTKLVMAEAEMHPPFTFAIMEDQGAIKWHSCNGCNAQQALIDHLRYIQRTYTVSPAYQRMNGKAVVPSFDVDLNYPGIDWAAVNSSTGNSIAFVFQNASGFSHSVTAGSYSWVMPTTTDFGMSYLGNFYSAGQAHPGVETFGVSYKGFNDTLAPWGSDRVLGQQCGQTWLQTFAKINSFYNTTSPLDALQLATWNDYAEGTEIETGIDNCLGLSARVSGGWLTWQTTGQENTVARYVVYVSLDGAGLLPLAEVQPGSPSLNVGTYGLAPGSYQIFVQAVGKPTLKNNLAGPVPFIAY